TCAALFAIVSSTGCKSVGELAITRRISLVAVCCSSPSATSRFSAAFWRANPEVFLGAERRFRGGRDRLFRVNFREPFLEVVFTK
ncbi:MAG: hypothetical protein V3W08_02475, partial [Candidatus Binatia bacterium]